MIACTNDTCPIEWLHSECIARDVQAKTYHNRLAADSSMPPAPPADMGYDGLVSATIVEGTADDMPPRISVKDERAVVGGKSWTEDVFCPSCRTIIV